MKRLIDTLIVIAGAPLVLPIILLCMIAIRLASPGPVIFRQLRVGMNEVPFTCYKLRTMDIGTSDQPSHMHKSPSVTPVGSRLRRWKLDELPQLWNVLRGEMSLVGPRPCLLHQHELIAARRARGLYAIRPGITGIAQIAGIDMSDPLKLAQADQAYLKNMGLVADLRIIIATVFGAGRGDPAG